MRIIDEHTGQYRKYNSQDATQAIIALLAIIGICAMLAFFGWLSDKSGGVPPTPAWEVQQ